MFEPPVSQLILYYFISLSFQKSLGLQVDFAEVRGLVEKGGDVSAKDNLGQTVLHDACREMDVATCEFLIDIGADLNSRDRYGRTPLHIAAAFDNHEIIPMLVDRGAAIDATSHGENQTPLHHAARNDSGTAPLSSPPFQHISSSYPCVFAGNACVTLVECGANIEFKDYRGRTPLLLAADLDR